MKINKKLIVFSLTLLIGSLVGINLVSAFPRDTLTSQESISITITDAYYADLDQDGLEDDIDVHLSFISGYYGNLRATFRLSLELPSGLIYDFLLEAWFRCKVDEPILFKVTMLNTATEPGWYTASIIGQIRGIPSGSFFTQSSMVFDPPTGTGSGNPTAFVTVF